MLDIIRADLYRIFRSKGIYITIFIFVLYIILQFSLGNVKVEVDNAGQVSAQAVTDVQFTGAVAVFETMSMLDSCLYFLLPIIVFIAAAEFSAGTIKNTLATGMSHAKIYLSKLLLALGFSFVFIVLYLTSITVLATVINGFGDELNFAFISRVMTKLIPQILLMLAVVSVGVFFCFVTQKTAAVNACYIGLCLAPIMLISAVAAFWPEVARQLSIIELSSNMSFVSHLQGSETFKLIRVYIVAFAYLIISTVGGIILFKRSEIR